MPGYSRTSMTQPVPEGKNIKIRSVLEDLSPDLDRIEDVCRGAGKLLMKHFGTLRSIQHKGVIDLVTEADERSEGYILQKIGELFPDHSILAEESAGRSESADCQSPIGDFKWIIDPLDGTTNFAHSFPHFCISVALEYRGILLFAVIYEPRSDEMFTARKSCGAFLNGRNIRVSRISNLDDSILATGFPYDRRTNPRNNLDHFSRLILRVQGIRRCGAAALDLAYLACGRIDGFWELGLHPWDMAAGVLLVEEAGGLVTNLQGNPMDIYTDDILASNGILHAVLRDSLSKTATDCNE